MIGIEVGRMTSTEAGRMTVASWGSAHPRVCHIEVTLRCRVCAVVLATYGTAELDTTVVEVLAAGHAAVCGGQR